MRGLSKACVCAATIVAILLSLVLASAAQGLPGNGPAQLTSSHIPWQGLGFGGDFGFEIEPEEEEEESDATASASHIASSHDSATAQPRDRVFLFRHGILIPPSRGPPVA